jgi:uncharacterized protein (DUF2235 family)
MRPLSAREDMLRQAAAACASSRMPNCDKTVHVGIFFDGTNNNKKRDQEDVLIPKDKDGLPLKGVQGDPNQCSHSNVVVLYDAYRDAPDQGYFAVYVPGVGTAFPEIGEPSESDEGKAYGKGGDARINWALIQLINAIHRAVYKVPLLEDKDAGKAATSSPMHREGLAANLEGKLQYLLHGTPGIPERRAPEVVPLLRRLTKALALRPKPRVALVNLSVFGFSRGAAQARAFLTVLQALLQHDGTGLIKRLRGQENPSYALAGIPLRIQFVGLFDTVASAGLADASPFWRGFGGWANGTMAIPDVVERTVHFVAGHEVRRAFPSSSLRVDGKMPRNCLEVVYPGAHSDVGGGYAAGDQGKAVGDRTALVSQVPLVEMYMEAIKSGVPMRSEAEMRETAQGANTLTDLQIHPKTAQLFNHYARWAAPKADLTEAMLHQHVRHYWRWRRQRGGPAFKTLDSLNKASPQHRTDLTESERDFREDHDRLMQAMALIQSGKAGAQRVDDPAGAAYLEYLGLQPVPQEIDAFFDRLIHDSHATFYMCGPTTELDRQKLVARIQQNQQAGKKLSRLEQRIADGQGVFPVLSDADTEDLLDLNDWYAKGALKVAGQRTRREVDGHIHYRQVFDRS